jgi:hypothetical protein
VQLQYSERDRH